MPVPNVTKPFFQPVILPQAIIKLFERMQQANTKPTSRNTALAIVEEYHSFFGCTGMRHDLWMLLSSAMSNDTSCLAKGEERYNLLFFYEFTLMLMDAVYVLHGEERFGKLV